MKKIKVRYRILIAIYIISISAYALSWKFPAAVDWYRLHLFPVSTNTLARLISAVPFSVGEVFIGLSILLLILIIPILLLGCFGKWRKLRKGYLIFLLWAGAYVMFTETFHCFVMYHATTLEEAYFEGSEYGEEELIQAYEIVIAQANELSMLMQRNQEQEVVYEGNQNASCISAMQSLGEEYPYLKGYYPQPKKIHNSDFMSQQYLGGMFFPFTMEANYNSTMYIMNRPATICHELSHLKGVILEDEANYFGFLACISSKDAFLQYSGYLSVLPYLEREVSNTVSEDRRRELPKSNALVQKDAVFLTEEAWEKVESSAVIKTETASKATDVFLDTNLKTNGISDGIESYSRVVRLVLDYYSGNKKHT